MGNESPGHSGALFLASGHLVGVLLQQRFNAQLSGQGQQPGLHLRVGPGRQHQGQQDVVLQGKGVQQIKVLEHKAQVLPPEGRQLRLPDVGQVAAVEFHLAPGGLVQGGQNVQEGGFAGAGLTHDGHEFALLYGKADAFQSLDLAAAQPGGVDLLQAVDFQK